MKTFTDVERLILEKTEQCYEWIARDKDGELYIYGAKPFRNEVKGIFGTEVGKVDIFNKCVSDTLFSSVTWENSPIQYRDSELLTPKEKNYLKFVFRPFASDIIYVQKRQLGNNIEYIRVITCTSSMPIYFPDFKKGTMYKGMKSEKKYTLKELGIVYDE